MEERIKNGHCQEGLLVVFGLNAFKTVEVCGHGTVVYVDGRETTQKT